MINRGEVEAYSIMIERLQREAGRRAASASRRVVAAFPADDYASVRNGTIDACTAIVHEYGDSVASLACDMYDSIMVGEGVRAERAMPWSGSNDDQIERAVRYQVQKFIDGDVDGFYVAVDELTQYYVRQYANNTTMENVERDNIARVVGGASSTYMNERFGNLDMPSRYGSNGLPIPRAERNREGDIAFARVPTGIETCSYCMMLASRGFVYRSKESAGHADHRGCNCMIVPGVYGESEIDGIDLEAQYDCWRDLESLEAYAAKHPEEFEKGELERRKAEIVGKYDNLTLSPEPGEVRKHFANSTQSPYTARAWTADSYQP